MPKSKRAAWSDTEHLHLIDLVEDRFAPFRQHGLGPVFWRTVADEMNRTFGSSRTASACQVAHSQLSTGVIPRPESPPEAADSDVRELLLDVLRNVEQIILDSLFSDAA